MSTEAAPSEKPKQTYPASCHCGYIKFSVTLSPPLPEYKPLQCNCSACRRFGYLLVCKSRSPTLQLSLVPAQRWAINYTRMSQIWAYLYACVNILVR